MSITLISTVTVGAGGAASIDFTSIPGIYTDLMVVVSSRSTRSAPNADDGLMVKLNGSTASFSGRTLYGTGSSAGSITTTESGVTSATSATSSTFGNANIYIPNYAGATNKSISIDSVAENNATSAGQRITATLWSNAAAITSVGVYAANGNLAEFSSASLYGVLKGSSGGVTVS